MLSPFRLGFGLALGLWLWTVGRKRDRLREGRLVREEETQKRKRKIESCFTELGYLGIRKSSGPKTQKK